MADSQGPESLRVKWQNFLPTPETGAENDQASLAESRES